MSDRDDLFVRGANGTVIGIAVEGHPESAPDADVITAMIPIVPIPESATIGPLPDVIEQANELANANARIADLEARLSAASGTDPGKTEAEQAADRIAELEAQLADKSASSSAEPAPPSPAAPSSPLVPAPVVAEVPTAPAPAPAWADLASGAKAPTDPTA